MNKKLKYPLLILILIFLIIIIFKNYPLFSDLTADISTIYLTKVFPFLFIMMVINTILIKLNFPYYLSHIIKNPALYTMILSIISGSPLNAIIVNNFLEQNIIDESDASIIICFTSFNNPLFLYNYFNLIFDNKVIIIKLFIIIYLTNIILYFILKKKLKTKTYYITYEDCSFNQNLTESIKFSINNMLNIYGTILFFYILTNIIIKNNTVMGVFAKGLIEITQGLNGLTTLKATLKAKELLSLAILQFQGLSIHIQISACLAKYNINYKYFYFSRIILILLSLGLGMKM